MALPRLFLQEPLRRAGTEKKVKIAIIGDNYESYELLDLLRRSKKYEPTCFLVHNYKNLFNKLDISLSKLSPLDFLSQHSKLGISKIIAPEDTFKKPWFVPLIEAVQSSQIPIFKYKGVDGTIYSLKNNIEIHPLSLKDLEIRLPQKPIKELLKRNIYNKTVMITGGGGSIGSELSKQLYLQAPKTIIIIDSNEYNLYQIEEELLELSKKVDYKVEVLLFLCSVLDATLLRDIFKDNKIDTVFHAAAYKHVIIVEKNPMAGFENNVIGTKNLVLLADEFKVSNFTFISTDKAVNPTNIMGVTKRLAEMICQSFGKKRKYTTFLIVRFGNVLGSSGSVIPKFEKQISLGGPVTVTHPNIIRYFMSITEAAELVIQSSAMARRSEVFVLDMGKPVKIIDLARRLCTLKGLSSYCVDEGTFSGDIEIRITGLRKEEKMFEEVLATKETISTEHPQIRSAKEDFVKHDKLFILLNEIYKALNFKDVEKIKKIFAALPQVNYSSKNLEEFCKNISKK